ncbi:MAG: hypothetical protein ABSE80_11160, partial [Halobacteriota archaeon]
YPRSSPGTWTLCPPRRTLWTDTSSKLRGGLAFQSRTAQNFRNPQLLVAYLNNVLSVLTRNQVVNLRALELLQTEKTFEFIKRFMKKRPVELSVTLPPNGMAQFQT